MHTHTIYASATELKIYNEASAATVASNRASLARALRAARQYDRTHPILNWRYYGLATLTERTRAHCEHVGWPIRLRPNGRYR